ncbi:MAG: hypothetical protein ACOCUL_05325 [Bacteroidota bacterium]
MRPLLKIYKTILIGFFPVLILAQPEDSCHSLEPNLELVTVNQEGNHLLVWEKEDGAADFVTVYRNPEKPEIEQIQYDINKNWIVNEIQGHDIPASYAISITDTCKKESSFSRWHKTMHLDVEIQVSIQKIMLLWNPYRGFEYDTFIIYRGHSKDQLSPFNRIPYDTGIVAFSYIDDLEHDLIFYQIGINYKESLNGINFPFPCTGPCTLSNIVSIVASNKKKIPLEEKIKIYQNSQGQLHLLISHEGKACLDLFSSTGEFMTNLYNGFIHNKLEKYFELNLQGFFLVRIRLENRITFKKIVIL